MWNRYPVFAACTMGLVLLGAPNRADACGITPPQAHPILPTPGASDVPRNVALIAETVSFDGLDPLQMGFKIVRSGGLEVETTITCFEPYTKQICVVIPTRLLEEDMDYAFHYPTANGEDTLSVQTGSSIDNRAPAIALSRVEDGGEYQTEDTGCASGLTRTVHAFVFSVDVDESGVTMLLMDDGPRLWSTESELDLEAEAPAPASVDLVHIDRAGNLSNVVHADLSGAASIDDLDVTGRACRVTEDRVPGWPLALLLPVMVRRTRSRTASKPSDEHSRANLWRATTSPS